MTLKTTCLTAVSRYVTALCIAVGVPAAHANPASPMTYDKFAAEVPHLTLSECPEFVTATQVDCHVARIAGTLHVLAFENAGDQRLVSVHSEHGNLDIGSFQLSARN